MTNVFLDASWLNAHLAIEHIDLLPAIDSRPIELIVLIELIFLPDLAQCLAPISLLLFLDLPRNIYDTRSRHENQFNCLAKDSHLCMTVCVCYCVCAYVDIDRRWFGAKQSESNFVLSISGCLVRLSSVLTWFEFALRKISLKASSLPKSFVVLSSHTHNTHTHMNSINIAFTLDNGTLNCNLSLEPLLMYSSLPPQGSWDHRER